jgi:hypothetical protein
MLHRSDVRSVMDPLRVPRPWVVVEFHVRLAAWASRLEEGLRRSCSKHTVRMHDGISTDDGLQIHNRTTRFAMTSNQEYSVGVVV